MTRVALTITMDTDRDGDDELLELLALAVGGVEGQGRVESCSFARTGEA